VTWEAHDAGKKKPEHGAARSRMSEREQELSAAVKGTVRRRAFVRGVAPAWRGCSGRKGKDFSHLDYVIVRSQLSLTRVMALP